MTRQELNKAAEANLVQLKKDNKTSQQQAALFALVGAKAFESIDAVMRRLAMKMAIQAA